MSSILNQNPFRTPVLTPQNTNNSTTSRPPGDTDTSQNARTVNINNVPLYDSVPDEAPPPYSLSADISHGEIPIEVGPPRPFQDSQRQGQVSSPVTQSTIRVNDSLSEPRVAPPPLPRRSSPITPIHTGIASPPRSPTGPLSERSPSAYVPPVGPPPTSPIRNERHTYDPPTGRPPRRPVSAASQPIDTRPIEDGRPTTTPVPGHPLLLKNKLLVYPPGYECSQCKNVGYRNNDPSHPCNKCWNKYARPYCGALAYAPFPSESGSSRDSGSRGSNFQRPLPRLRAPQTNIYNTPSSSSSYPRTATATQAPPNQQRLLRRRSETKPNIPRNDHLRTVSSPGPTSPRISTNIAPRPSPVSPRQSQLLPTPTPLPERSRRSSCIAASSVVVPPPGSVIYQAGDPRLGGRLCWRCEGRGTVSYFFLDTSTCETCNGIGRTFR